MSIETSFSFCTFFALEGMICILVRPFASFVPLAAASGLAVVEESFALDAREITPTSLGAAPLATPSIIALSTPEPRYTPVPGIPPPGVAPAYKPPEIGFNDRPLPSNLPPRPAAASGLPLPSPARAYRPPPRGIFFIYRALLIFLSFFIFYISFLKC